MINRDAAPQSDKVNIGKKELKLLQINFALVMPSLYERSETFDVIR